MKKNIIRSTILACTLAGVITLGSSTSEAALGDRTLSPGMNHSDVMELQQGLRQLNFFNHANNTTYFGSITKQAVQKFQQANGLTVDGYFGPASAGVLKSKLSGAPNSSPQVNTGSTPSAPSSNGLLKQGSRGAAVTSLQQSLHTLGYYTGSIDGIFGSGNKVAVMNFQRAQGISVDGIVGSATLASINNALSGKAPANPAPKPTPNTSSSSSNTSSNGLLKSGSRGAAVTTLQQSLATLGYYKSSVDGIFGGGTKTAVMNFQRAQGLSVDGVVGANTTKCINQVLATGKPSNTPPSGVAVGGVSIDKDIANKVINTAKKYIGHKYVFGGCGPSGFDCSGFTQYVYNQTGVNIPRTTTSQATVGKALTKSQVQPGDLVVFNDTYKKGPSHVGVYVGDGNFVHAANSQKGVRVDSIHSSYYSSKFASARRVF